MCFRLLMMLGGDRLELRIQCWRRWRAAEEKWAAAEFTDVTSIVFLQASDKFVLAQTLE